jgi:hypothetical protein
VMVYLRSPFALVVCFSASASSYLALTDTRWRRMPRVGSPGGISPPGSHGTVRNSLPLHGSYHPGHQNEWTHFHCANSNGSREVTACHHALAFLNPCNRLYFLRAHRTR